MFPGSAAVAQLTVNQLVVGSNPTPGAKIVARNAIRRRREKSSAIFSEDAGEKAIKNLLQTVERFFKLFQHFPTANPTLTIRLITALIRSQINNCHGIS